MKRVIVVALVLVGLGVGAFFVLNRGEAAPVGGSPVAVAEPESESGEIAAALQRLKTDPASLVATNSAEEVAGRAGQGVPPGTDIKVDEGSWEPDGAGGGVIAVTLTPPGGSPQVYAAVMVLEDDGWKVLATAPVEGAP
ncbi:hypothetical protein L6E12_17075 [Actinokineospora sp. PR83]|uniref:hypothetical protein n=1 Tax=Actinokineospora sp. PR83 TaxID=2884908 RepID=UPI001F200A4C|nr:hypothetical protein [Actinokineospora sp. PR83]MCG8917499.1 hypothetical protein [Actinokineospora sp. PR83]